MYRFLFRFFKDWFAIRFFGRCVADRKMPRRQKRSSSVPAWLQLEPREMLAAVTEIADVANFEACELWVEDAHAHDEPRIEMATANIPPFPLGSTFQLSSRPFATKTIYLDFNGHVTTNTVWNSDYGRSSIISPAYDFEGGASVFTDNELARIQSVWQSVAEKFSPFEVNVTTQEPPLSDLVNNGGSDNRWGMRVAIGGQGSVVLSPQLSASTAGIAYQSSFGDNDTPCFVFADNLNDDEMDTAYAIAHEVGHTLGLSHDGLLPATNANEYYRGHGTGLTSWAPIMGGGFGRNVVQWSAGTYPNASNRENDLAIITTSNANGFGYRVDDHANFAAQSTQLLETNGVFFGRGVIEQTSDWDFFRLDVAGPAVVTIDPAERGGMLDVGVQLFDANLNVIGNYDNYDQLNAVLSFGNTPATYYLRVFGVGKPSFGLPDEYGYPSYGSLGQYTIRGTVYTSDPDDQLSEATTITTTASITDRLDYGADVDMFRFNVQAGERVKFDLDKINGTRALQGSVLRLFDSNGVMLEYNVSGPNPEEQNLPGEEEAYLDWKFAAAGTYHVGVSSFANLNYNPITGDGDAYGLFGDYSLTLTSLGVQPNTDPDDQISEAVQFSSTGVMVGSINPSGDVDMYWFQAAENERLLFDIDKILGATAYGLSDPYLRLFDSSGQQVAFNDDGPTPGESESVESYLDVTMAVGGTYYLGVSGGNRNYDPITGFGDVTGSPGDYQVQMTRIAPPNRPPVVFDQFWSVDENSETGTFVWTFFATDPDVGQKLTYMILDGNEEGTFAIDSSTGTITVANPTALDAEVNPEFVFTVLVIDNGTNPLFSAAGKMTIRVRDVNDAPQFGPNGFSLPENSPKNTVVGKVNVTDEDAGQTLTYSIVDGNLKSTFAIDSKTGVITVANPAALDYEAGPRSTFLPDFSLTVAATDNGDPSLTSTAFVNIGLSDVNEAPTVVPRDCLIGENSVNNAFITTIAAFDPDIGQVLTFAITAGNINNAFAINPNTGVFSVKNSAMLNFEATQQFNLTVSVTDNAAPALSASAPVRVFLRDVNEFAPVVQAKDFLIGEGSVNNAFIGTIAATDGDTAQSRTFAITAGNTGNAFRIHPETGVLAVNNASALDFETSPQFNLTVTVTDSGSPARSGSAIARVFLRDVNESPVVVAKDFSIGENSANGAFIGTVVATDPDAGQTKTFAISSGNTNNAFAINPSSGVMTINNAAALDFEKTPQFNLTVTVTDSGNPAKAGTAQIRIYLRDVNEAPVVPTQSFAVRTRASAGTFVGTVSASDPDAGQSLSFTIESGNGLFNSIFKIDARTGRITVNNPLSILFAGQYNLGVRVRDNATPSLSTLTSVRIFVNSTGTVPGSQDVSRNQVGQSPEVKLNERSLAVKKGPRTVAKLFGH